VLFFLLLENKFYLILFDLNTCFFTALDCADVNLALSKPASQPSTYSDAVAARAVDGNRGTMSCTLGLVHPWLSVDLGAQYNVGHVTVMNDLNAGAGNYIDKRINNAQ